MRSKKTEESFNINTFLILYIHTFYTLFKSLELVLLETKTRSKNYLYYSKLINK